MTYESSVERRFLDYMKLKAKRTRKTVVKGSAGKMVEAPEIIESNNNWPLPVRAEKPSASILLIKKAKELLDQGKSIPTIAGEMGKDEDWVHASLLIAAKLPDSVHDAISKGKFSRTAALQLLLVQRERIEEIVEGALKIAESEGKL